MNKPNLKLSIFIPAILFTACFALPVAAQAALSVVFEVDPLFDELAIMPGDSVTRFVRVTNPDPVGHTLAVKAVGVEDVDALGSQMDLAIVRHGTAGEYYNGTLAAFLNGAPVDLGALASLESAQYDFTVSFRAPTGNEYQKKTLKFDIVIGLTGDTVAVAGTDAVTGSTGYAAPTQRTARNSNPATDGAKVLGLSGEANLTIGKTTPRSNVNPGEDFLEYRVAITNNGQISAFDATLTDTLPEGFTFSGTKERTKTWVLGDIAPGEVKTVEYVVAVSENQAAGNYDNVAVIRAAELAPLEARAVVSVTPVTVLGTDSGNALTPTGFSIREFAVLFCAMILAFGLSRYLKSHRAAGK